MHNSQMTAIWPASLLTCATDVCDAGLSIFNAPDQRIFAFVSFAFDRFGFRLLDRCCTVALIHPYRPQYSTYDRRQLGSLFMPSCTYLAYSTMRGTASSCAQTPSRSPRQTLHITPTICWVCLRRALTSRRASRSRSTRCGRPHRIASPTVSAACRREGRR